MKTFIPANAQSGLLVLVACCLFTAAAAGNGIDDLRKDAEEQIEALDTQAGFKKVELGQKYVTALEALEKKLADAGKLDEIVALREEIAEVKKSGGTTGHEDKALVDLRAKYLKSLDGIDAGMKVSRAKVVEGLSAKIREQEVALTKAGKVEEALELRREGGQLLLRLSAGAAADLVPFADDPRAGTAPGLKDLEPVEWPKESPPLEDNPFLIEGNWLKSMTVAPMKQKIREPLYLGNRNEGIWIHVVVSPHSVWSGAERGLVHLHGASLAATKSRFENLELGADHGNRFYFRNCAFTDCKFPKIGWWHDGGWFFAKHYFENCHFKGSYSGTLTLQQSGIRAQNCVFEGIDFPTYRFQKHQPADFVNDKWLRIAHCRFVKCKIPLSFLLLTRDGIFENCIVSDDIDRGDDVEITKAIEIDVYASNLQMRVNKMPAAVKINQKKYNELKGVTIPTAASLEAQMR
jgi:hypothetical protein